MKDIDLEAFRPVPFPELGPKKTFNANFCRNPMCPNFGPAPDLDASAERYSVFRDSDVRTDRRFKCRLCEMSSRLLSNHCLRAAYAWFKRQSIPFATCPRQGCVNAGVNVFEHWEPDLYGYDNKNRSDVVRCVKCGTRFSIGQALGLHGDKADPKGMERRLTTIFKHVRLGLGMRTSIALLEDPAIQQRHWLHAVERLAWKLLDYNSLCNAKLMAKRYPNRLPQLFRNANGGEEDPGPLDSPFNGIATLRTDMMSVSLRTPTARYENRFHPMPVLMTVMRIHRPSTWFLLAAHPCVVFDMADMPPAEKEDPNALVRDARAPVAERRFDHLYHSATRYPKPEENRRYRDEPEEKRGKRRQKTSYVGGGGRFMRLDYADIAHFMVVSELTRGFRQVTVCMDGERKAYRSACAVFAEDMRTPLDKGSPARRVEIAVLQSKSGAGAPGGERNKVWETQKEEIAKRWKGKLEAERRKAGLGSWDDAPELLARAKARLFVQAMVGAWRDESNWGWLSFPPQPGRRTALLWLSQGPDRDWTPEAEAETFLRYASLQSVDSAIQVMRRRAPAARRPRTRADHGPGYSEVSMSAKAAVHGIWLAWFATNYTRPWGEQELMPARLLGLMRPEDRNGFNIARRVRVRLGWEHAREITRRNGNG